MAASSTPSTKPTASWSAACGTATGARGWWARAAPWPDNRPSGAEHFEVVRANQGADLRLQVGRVMDQDVRAGELDPAAGAIVQDQLDFVGAGRLDHDDVELFEHPDTGVVVLTAGDHHAHHPTRWIGWGMGTVRPVLHVE